jgi:hypothetical protein
MLSSTENGGVETEQYRNVESIGQVHDLKRRGKAFIQG